MSTRNWGYPPAAEPECATAVAATSSSSTHTISVGVMQRVDGLLKQLSMLHETLSRLEARLDCVMAGDPKRGAEVVPPVGDVGETQLLDALGTVSRGIADAASRAHTMADRLRL